MAYRNGNYAAFYVAEPFSESNLGANATRDFYYYNLLRAWKGRDTSFPFIDSHDKNYNVRDGSSWELTLKPRIRERLRNSKNMILFLSSITKNSRALREEVDYGINDQGLPVIVVYPEFSEKADIIGCSTKKIQSRISRLWTKVPTFNSSMHKVPTLHVPLKEALIRNALADPGLMVRTKARSDVYFYPC